MEWSYGAPFAQQHHHCKVASYAYDEIPTPPLAGVDVLIVENPPPDYTINTAEFLGWLGTVVSAGPCLVIGRLPLMLSVIKIPSQYGTFHEVTISGASEPTKKSPGVLLLVAEHDATTDFKGFLETVTKFSHPTNACPTYSTIAFTREQPLTFFPTLVQAGGSCFDVFRTCGSYHMTLSEEVPKSYETLQRGGVNMMWPLSLAGNGQVVDAAIERAEQTPSSPDWEGSEASADGSDGADSEMSERPATEQRHGSDGDDSEMSEPLATEQRHGSDSLETQRSNSAEHAAKQWEIWASHEQVKAPKHKFTHQRPVSLPCTIDGWIMGKSYCQAQYEGHGQSKTVYRLTDKLVLKLCEKTDQEPELFQALQASGVYPMVHASCQCQVFNSAGRPAQTWHAWVMDYAKPLDQILKEDPAISNVCILGAIHAMVTAHSREHLLSDNALFNFGMVQDNVVIIDAGSRAKTPPMTRGEFNKKVMKPFWSKAQTLVQPADLEVHREQWKSAGWNMDIVLQTYQERWQNLCNAEQPFPVLNTDGADSEMSERLATEQPQEAMRPPTEQPLEEYVLAWDLHSYTLSELINHYGERIAHKIWQPSLHATTDARTAMKNLHKLDGPALANFRSLISGWVATAQTSEIADEMMLAAFYIPLRWRYEFLQSENVSSDMWGSYDLSAQQCSMWKHVKESVFNYALTPQQRDAGNRNTLNHVINKLCKNMNFCKLLLNFGVTDIHSLKTILGSLAAQRGQPGPRAQRTIDVLRAQDRLRLRSRSRTRSRSCTWSE
jgi:hypothetical protein